MPTRFAVAFVAFVALAGIGGPAPAAAWFWADISPSAEAADAGRQTRSLNLVREANRTGVFRFGSTASARAVAQRWRTDIDKAARRYRISEALLIAIIMVESGGNPGAVSPAGARGLAQLMPGTAARYGVRNIHDPSENIQGGASYLSDLLAMFDGDWILALAAYNAGEQAVLRHRGVPPFAETRAYVPKVLSAFLSASELCNRPPRSARQRCALPRPRPQ